jgi:hypothetical protein
LLVTVTARSRTWTLFDSSNTGILGSNPIQGLNICVRLFWVCAVLCVGSGPATGWSPPPICPTDFVKDHETEKAAKAEAKGYRAIDRQIVFLLVCTRAFNCKNIVIFNCDYFKHLRWINIYQKLTINIIFQTTKWMEF